MFNRFCESSIKKDRNRKKYFIKIEMIHFTKTLYLHQQTNTKMTKILIIGACGQIGTELTLRLRAEYGNDNVIASDIRQLEHIEYTPAPDIIHEGAGHAPIIANPEYAEYLRRFGEIGCKAISSNRDYELYEAIRLLSILKEAENTPIEKIEKAIEQLPQKQKLIFHMCYKEEMPYAQIAEITGTSEGALKASFHHAVKKIEEKIKKN
jgi:RNA polymerase sigma factor (sigma-70 family)